MTDYFVAPTFSERLFQVFFVAVVVCLIIAPFLFAAWHTGLIPEYAEICSKNEKTDKTECAPYHVTLVFGWHILKALQDYNGLITALATVFIALLTWYLKVSTHRLWEEAKATREISLQAAKATGVSADAAQESATAAIKTAMPVLYPHVVSMDGLHPVQHQGDDPVSFTAAILVHFRNFGRSAGSIRQVKGDLFLSESGRLPEVNYDALTVHGYAVMVPPGDTEGPEIGALDVKQDFTLTSAEFGELLAEGRGRYRRFVFIGQVIYDDFFGLRHTSRFSVKMRIWLTSLNPRTIAVFQVPDGGSRYNWVTSEQIPEPDPLSA